MRLFLFALVSLSMSAAAQVPFVQSARLVPAEAPDGGQFGRAVALSGDRLLVSSSPESSASVCPREAVVFARTADGWTEEATLTPDASVCFWTGASLALDGDVAVLGRTNESDGRVFVFERRGANWIQTATLVRPGPPTAPGAGNDSFGNSISLNGDRLLVGSIVGATLFERLGDGTWTAGTPLSTEAPRVLFGYLVALAGDRALIAGYPDVVVMRETPAGWTREAVLEVDGERSGDQGVYALAFDGAHVAAGRPSQNRLRGQVSLFSRSGTTWTREPVLLGDETTAQFGVALALDGANLLVGAPFFAGAVTHYRREDGAWVSQGRLGVIPAAQGTDSFGWSLALENGRVVVGARQADDAANPDPFDDTGAVYVYESERATAAETPVGTEARVLSAAVPNPALGRTTLRLRLDAPTPICAVLVDALGRTIQTLYEGIATGETILTVDASRLPAGVYAVRVSGVGVTEARRLTVVR